MLAAPKLIFLFLLRWLWLACEVVVTCIILVTGVDCAVVAIAGVVVVAVIGFIIAVVAALILVVVMAVKPNHSPLQQGRFGFSGEGWGKLQRAPSLKKNFLVPLWEAYNTAKVSWCSAYAGPCSLEHVWPMLTGACLFFVHCPCKSLQLSCFAALQVDDPCLDWAETLQMCYECCWLETLQAWAESGTR